MNTDTHKTELLDKEAILTTEARQTLFDSLMQGMRPKEAAKQAKLAYSTVRKYCTKWHFNELIRQEKAKIQAKVVEKLKITEETQILRFQALSEGAEGKGQYSAAVSAEDKVTTICGLYERDNAQKGDKTLIVGDERRMEQLEAELALLKRSKALGSAVCTG